MGRRKGTSGRSNDPGALSVQIRSELAAVEDTVELVARHCVTRGLSVHTASFNLRVALAEALANAIVYGNDQDPDKSVEIEVCVRSGRFEIHVRDQGRGFDPERVPDPTTPEHLLDENGRGLFLIRRLVDDVTFNDRGNAICMVLRRA